MMNTEYKYWRVNRWEISIQFPLQQVKKKIYQLNQGQCNMWPKLQGKQTPTRRSVYLVNPVIQTWKYETLSDLWHRALITRMCHFYQMNEEIPARGRHFSHVCIHFSPETLHHFLSRCSSPPTSCLTFPPLRSTPTHPPPHTSPGLWTGRLCWEKTTGWWVGFFPGPDLFESANTDRPFLRLDWMIRTAAAAS